MINSTQTRRKIFGRLLISVSILLSLVYLLFHRHIIFLLERYISNDHEITPRGDREISLAFFSFTIILFIIGVVLLKAKEQGWLDRILHVIFTEPLSSKASARSSPQFIFVTSTLIGLLLILSFWYGTRVPAIKKLFYAEDAILETLTVIALLVSVWLIGTAVWRLLHTPGFSRRRGILVAIYLVLMAALFIFAMEEISWGQRIFGWETPEWFPANDQYETTLHNLDNLLLLSKYWTLSFVLVIVLIAAWLELKQCCLFWVRLVLPHPSLVGLGLLIAIVAILGSGAILKSLQNELLEELLSVFIFFYSLRIHCFVHPKKIPIEI